jgi:hypothetical protein
MCKEKEPWADYVGLDLFGYEYNRKYPPNADKFGNNYGGYATPNQEVFFYDYCIQQYGIVFSYDEVLYEAEFTDEGPILTNKTANEVQGPFDSAVQLLEEAKINGKKMIDIIDELQNIVLH